MRFILIPAMLLLAGSAFASERWAPPLPAKQFPTLEERRAVARYRAHHAAYRNAQIELERKAAAYWNSVESKRKRRLAKRARGEKIMLADYVLKQPPAYSGPPEPALPDFIPPSRAEPTPKRTGEPLPVVADFLRDAKRRFNFVPEKPDDESDYKHAYARTALAAGITKDQAVRIYGFEASGNGKYDVQAGLESGRKGRPISTALGYNQLLVANTIGLVAKYGEDFVAELEDRAAAASGERRKTLKRKIGALRRMIRFARAIPYRWSRHVAMSGTAKGRALHALILDVDIGPLLQTQKLVNSINYAKAKGYRKQLRAAELEMLNLTGDGNGFDMISLPQAMREKVPTANFFQRGGYERNPVASRNNVAASLLEATDRKMDYHAALDGAKQLAAAFDKLMQEARSEGSDAAVGAMR
jgi:hypothetical protein